MQSSFSPKYHSEKESSPLKYHTMQFFTENEAHQMYLSDDLAASVVHVRQTEYSG